MQGREEALSCQKPGGAPDLGQGPVRVPVFMKMRQAQHLSPRSSSQDVRCTCKMAGAELPWPPPPSRRPDLPSLWVPQLPQWPGP